MIRPSTQLFRVLALCLLLGTALGQLRATAPAQDYVKDAQQGAIFIYAAGTRPCSAPVPGNRVLPLGSGFPVWLERTTPTPGKELGIRFLITAQHVIGSAEEITVRLNRVDSQQFVCYKLRIIRSGNERNTFSASDPSVDLIAIHLPDIPGADPLVFGLDVIADGSRLKELNIGVGAEIFTVGYLYGYAGEKQNYPVTKFGKIALLTDEHWLLSPRNVHEQGYVVELQNAPGLSGAPVLLYPLQFRTDGQRVQYQLVAPRVIGVIKDLLVAPVGPQGFPITEGVAVVEPGDRLRELILQVRDELRRQGYQLK